MRRFHRQSFSVCVALLSGLAASPVLARELAVVGGDLVDVTAMRPLHRLSGDLVLASAVTDDTAYVWTRDRRLASGGVGSEELRAHAVTSGALRWSARTGRCWLLAALPVGAVCSSEGGAVLFGRDDGKASPVGARTEVAGLTNLGGRLLILHTDRRLTALDASARPVGTVTVPVPPDGGLSHGALEVAGKATTLACGAQRNDAGVTVFCVDATPQVVWRRRVPVQGGILVQVDPAVLVLSSDSWAKRGSGAVLRTADGTLLSRTPFRPAAALTDASGQLESVLAPTADGVALHGPAGAVRWRWTGPVFHREAMQALRAGANLVIARYNPIATGTMLMALDAGSGRLAWTATVDSLPIAHSKYSNQVTLEARPGGTVLLRGHESAQDYLQTFDAATGRRTASVLRGR